MPSRHNIPHLLTIACKGGKACSVFPSTPNMKELPSSFLTPAIIQHDVCTGVTLPMISLKPEFKEGVQIWVNADALLQNSYFKKWKKAGNICRESTTHTSPWHVPNLLVMVKEIWNITTQFRR